jgi:hypothetical protein
MCNGVNDREAGGMADYSDDLNRIIKQADTRKQYDAHSYFEPPESIVKFARKVEAWMTRYEIPMSVSRFKDTFIHLGQTKLGFAGYVERIVPRLYTDSEFTVLMETLGYEVTEEEDVDEYSENPIRALVVGSDTWDNPSFIGKTLRQLPPSTILYTNARSRVDLVAVKYWDEYGYQVKDIQNPKKMFSRKDCVLVFHEDISNSIHSRKIAKHAKEKGIGVKIMTGTKKVEIDVQELAGR